MMFRFTLLIILISLSLNLVGQNCNQFHKNKECKVQNSFGFKNFGQSRSAVVEAGKTYSYQVALFGGYDYKIGLCTERGYTPIHIKITNKADQAVLYDNLDDDYTETVGFANENTKNVIFEITLLASDMEFRDVGDNRVCLGIAIYWRKIPKLGVKDENE